jgi:nucleoside diphosphate kinase
MPTAMAIETTGGDELAYALVTPYSLHKSRTGGILARLLWADVELVAARMYAPRPESGFIEEYCDAIYDPAEQDTPLRYQRMLIEYVLKNFGQPNVGGISNRLALLVFRGPNAVAQIAAAAGRISEHVQGDTVRGTYGDYFREESARLQRSRAFRTRLRLMDKYERLYQVDSASPRNDFFEPAVLTGTTAAMNEAHLKLFRKYAYSDGGFVIDAIDGLASAAAETSTVILKPESFRNRNPLPGNLIDFFARAGMFITGMKVLELSVDEAREFYGLKVPQFREQLKGMVAARARHIVAEARMLAEQAIAMGAGEQTARDPRRALPAARAMEDFLGEKPGPTSVKPQVVERIFEALSAKLGDLDPQDLLYDEIAEELKDLNAQAEFRGLIRYMTGKDSETGEPVEPRQRTRCMAILYSGEDALSVIRKRLKEMREVYGQNVLQNRAHASDPEEDPVKEVTVLGMPNSPRGEAHPCDVERAVTELYGPEQAT